MRLTVTSSRGSDHGEFSKLLADSPGGAAGMHFKDDGYYNCCSISYLEKSHICAAERYVDASPAQCLYCTQCDEQINLMHGAHTHIWFEIQCVGLVYKHTVNAVVALHLTF